MLLDDKSADQKYSRAPAISQDIGERKRSKKVPQRVRQSTFKDAKIIGKMRAFRVPAALATDTSLVAHSTPSTSHPSSSSYTHPKASNDNLIPVWSLTGDVVKAVAATAALQIAERAAYAFTFNLTRKAREAALTHPAGFLESLKRRFDKQLERAGVGFPYWFCIDTDRDGRLHIQGAFEAVIAFDALREVMWRAWGKWPGAGVQFQIWISRKPCDDGWATYCMRNQRRVAKIIGPRTFTINHPLRRDAEWTYGEVRRIMRSC
ncbi:hypothetical protein [Bradyrhizobium sp. Leo170]|uniref:hypothetical protein n=1 Tax=Bradyrhizobium sp. Leo170 TaxID=1571199 RepID=UPI00102EBC2E|nr:hypothetical protein [Bradyrhizobium sp. Leo170]TAI63462.1 hypothetical protein CWO89_24140 [Bradyrhizobium sp. Leo170]